MAKTAGFCMGVRRAVEMVLDAPNQHEEPIYTYGPLIHNPQVLELLQEKGIRVLADVPETGPGTVLVRAHGVPPEARHRLKAAGFRVIDATCPRVIKVQTIIRKHTKKGYASIIIGDRDHPEVSGLLGYAGDQGHVVDSLSDLDDLPPFDRAIIVAQTTQNRDFYDKVAEWASRNHPHYKVFHTICDSTSKRQAEIQELSREVDAIVVVGGHNSGNTRRLAQIAGQTGKPVYQVETETELDLQALSSVERVGLTAGASTPNWIIRRVYRTLEQIPLRRAQGWRRMAFTLQRALLLTNIYVSLGAGSLCYANMKLQGIDRYFPFVLIAVLYVQSMHILNNLIGTKADRYNDPDRASFYDHHKLLLTTLAVTGGAVGLLAAYAAGVLPFSLLLFMSLMGLSYNLKVLPPSFLGGRIRRLRDIPGSKTVLIALAWGMVTTLVPTLSARGGVALDTLIVLFWSTGLVFVRTAFFDILDVQGDRIVGQGTIPILLGEQRTLSLLKGLLAALTVLMAVAGLAGWVAPVGAALSVCPLSIGLVLLAHERGRMHPGIRLEFLVETHFILAGVIALLGSMRV
jgi:4-hydroxy-3-methylbut-2-enyl diphosphate reductase